MCVFVRASDDMKSHMVAADSMEEFQKELDEGKVSNITLCVCVIPFKYPSSPE